MPHKNYYAITYVTCNICYGIIEKLSIANFIRLDDLSCYRGVICSRDRDGNMLPGLLSIVGRVPAFASFREYVKAASKNLCNQLSG
jgi:hypothetical protein